MKQSHTIELLKECDSGVKMAVFSIDEVYDDVHSEDMKALMDKSKEHHETLGKEIENMLQEFGQQEEEPTPIAKGMAWMSTNIKLGMDSSEQKVADILVQGCHMGIKSLHKYLNEYETAQEQAKDICKKLIDIEEEFCRDLYPYL
ncbi:MAG: hypothetical protein IJP29_06450 [Lachnospiraceae bacterium]|nr:hypothetical protein [Lachnospiraceae bacterium]